MEMTACITPQNPDVTPGIMITQPTPDSPVPPVDTAAFLKNIMGGSKSVTEERQPSPVQCLQQNVDDQPKVDSQAFLSKLIGGSEKTGMSSPIPE